MPLLAPWPRSGGGNDATSGTASMAWITSTSRVVPAGSPRARRTCLRRWFAAGLSIVEMARRLSVSTATVDRALRRLRLHQPKSPTPVLPGIEPEEVPATTDSAHAAAAAPSVLPSAGAATDALSDGARADALVETAAADVGTAAHTPLPSVTAVPGTPASDPALAAAADTPEPVVPLSAGFTIDQDPRDRSGDRFLARQGLLADAVPLFADAEALPRAGVWLALPLLVRHNTLSIFQKIYGSLAPAFYGLRTVVVTLFLWPCCGSSGQRTSRSMPPANWDHSSAWIGWPRSKRCAASCPSWRRTARGLP